MRYSTASGSRCDDRFQSCTRRPCSASCRIMQWQPLGISAIRSRLQISQSLLRRSLAHRAVSACSVADILSLPQSGDSYEVTASGSVRTIRRHKSVAFVELGDGSTIHTLQALLRAGQAERYHDVCTIDRLSRVSRIRKLTKRPVA